MCNPADSDSEVIYAYTCGQSLADASDLARQERSDVIRKQEVENLVKIVALGFSYQDYIREAGMIAYSLTDYGQISAVADEIMIAELGARIAA
jgi:phosphoribosylformylglycinamidine (FGAM) synthase-like amidotransferase family enzyme